jgi:hypothetical protein
LEHSSDLRNMVGERTGRHITELGCLSYVWRGGGLLLRVNNFEMVGFW